MKERNILALTALAFLALLMFVFSEFVFDSSKFMLSSDALNGLGGLPTFDALTGSIYHPLALLRFVMDPGRAEGWIFIPIF